MDDFDAAFNKAVASPFKEKIKSHYDPYNIWDDSFDEDRWEEAGGYSEWRGAPPTAEEESCVRDPAVRGQLLNQASEQDAWRKAYLGAYAASRSSEGVPDGGDEDWASGVGREDGDWDEGEDGGGAWARSRDGPLDVSADDWFADDPPGAPGAGWDGGGDSGSVEMNVAGFWPDREEFRDLLVKESKWRVGLVGDWIAPLVKAEAMWRYGLYKGFLAFLDAGYADGFDTVDESFGRDQFE
jgi:hypothetical protein